MSGIDCAFYGFCAADAEARTSEAGKPWTRMRVGVGKGDDIQWVGVAVFGHAAEEAASLKKADKVYVEGRLTLDSWRGQDGVERHGLSVAAFKCERTHQIGRSRPSRDRDDHASDHHGNKPQASGGAPFEDDVPFAPEWK